MDISVAMRLYQGNILLISYKFVKGFLAITFYYFLFLAETFMMSVNVFYITRNEIAAGSKKEV